MQDVKIQELTNTLVVPGGVRGEEAQSLSLIHI